MSNENAKIVIVIGMEEKKLLEKEASLVGLPLSSYCRMILIKSVRDKIANETKN